SLLLVEPPVGTASLAAWLAGQGDGEQRRLVLRRAAELLRRLHDAGCSFAVDTLPAEELQVRDGETPELVLGSVEGVRKCCGGGSAARDLEALCAGLGSGLRRTERLWLVLGYLEVSRLTPTARRLASRILKARGAGEA